MADVKVEQCDRVLGLHFIPRNSIAGQDREGVLAGKYDDAQAIVLVARHRQAAEKAQHERDAGVAKSRERADDFNQPYIEGWNEACDEIATAIRSQGHE